jgi:hypothetical protein
MCITAETSTENEKLNLVICLCSYYVEKGYWVAITARVTNLVAIGFTAIFTGFLVLWVDWAALDSECLHNDSCDILDVSKLFR